MRHLFCFTVVSGLGLLCMQPAVAQVYQCLDSAGKKVFSQTPCATGSGNSEKLIVRAPAPAAAPKDWAAENAAANARATSGSTNSGTTSQPWPLAGLRKGTPTTAPTSDKKIIADCEANHGARCSSAGEIAQRRMEQRELTPVEKQQQQNAVAARRQREREEALERSMRR